MILRFVLLIFGVFACATAVVMVKASDVHPVLLSSLRLLVASAALAPLFFRDLRRHRGSCTRRHLLATVLPGAILALHFISWIVGARMTGAANSSLIVNITPLVMPFFLFALIRERVSARELAGTAVAMTGVVILGASDFDLGPRHFAGDVVCFVSMLFFAFYLALGRRNRDYATIWLYVVPLYFVAGVLCLLAYPASLAFEIIEAAPRDPPNSVPWEALMVLGLGLVPTVMGHSILNHSMKHFRGQVVGIVNLFQFVFAGVMGYVFLTEIPGRYFYVAAVLLVAGVAVALRPRNGTEQEAPTAAGKRPD